MEMPVIEDSDCLDGEEQKYNFRRSSVVKRIRTEEKQKIPKKERKREKTKPQPLSKYRRKSANLRERTRINDMNEAYETLRLALPEMTTNNKAKLPKQTILHLALNYIKALRSVLGYEELVGSGSDGESTSTDSTSDDGFIVQSPT